MSAQLSAKIDALEIALVSLDTTAVDIYSELQRKRFTCHAHLIDEITGHIANALEVFNEMVEMEQAEA